MKTMEPLELMKERHSVRSYEERPIEEEKRVELDRLIEELNETSGLSIRILYDEPKCFDSFMAHYGKFEGVRNYVSLAGKKGKDLDERLGYYGEQLVLKARDLGLDTCYVALTHGKSAASLKKGEKERCLIAIGYGKGKGFPHKSKSIEEIGGYKEGMPDWYRLGLEAALLAPSALNQQKYRFSLEGEKVVAKPGKGFYVKLDLGIAKYHFEAVTGHKVD